jgi:hypothetical protein
MDINSVFCKLEEMNRDNFQKFYDRANEAEVVFFNCGQCIFVPFIEYLGFDPLFFKAGSGLAGGIGMKGDACGAYNGGAILIGSLIGRTYDDLNGDLEAGKNKYRESCLLVQKFRDEFVSVYGGTNCKEVQTCVFGRSYDLTDTKTDYPAFCAAGAHTAEKCPAVIGNAARIVARIMYEDLKEKQKQAASPSVRTQK